MSNTKPPSLAELLAEIMNPSSVPDYHQEFIDDVMAEKALNSEGKAIEDESIKYYIFDSPADEDKKELYYSAYIHYLAKTLFYHDQSQNDAAWYYYAQSRYYKGLFNTWDAVLNQVDAHYKKIEDKRQGGIKKAAKLTGAIKDEFGGCKNFCVNGHYAGNCYYFLRSRNDCKQRINRQPAGRLQETRGFDR